MQRTVFGPTGMAATRIADDPRGVVGDYMRGHGLDLTGAARILSYGAVGSYAPVISFFRAAPGR